jgi:hypothetical protein
MKIILALSMGYRSKAHLELVPLGIVQRHWSMCGSWVVYGRIFESDGSAAICNQGLKGESGCVSNFLEQRRSNSEKKFTIVGDLDMNMCLGVFYAIQRINSKPKAVASQ